MKSIILSLLIASVPSVFAAETTCTVKGMHCQGCQEMVEGKVCDEAKYSKCDVKITDAKKELGTIHVVTKDAAAAVDEKLIIAQVAETGYKVEKCTPAKKPAKKA